MFKRSELIEKREILRLILSDQPVLKDDLKIDEIVNLGAQSIFNLKYDCEMKYNLGTYGYHNLENHYSGAIIATAIKIEQDKRNLLSKRTAIKILCFLTDFAKITSKNLCFINCKSVKTYISII